MNIYVKVGTPGCASVPVDVHTKPWEAICHLRVDFIWIVHRPHRETSRWVTVDRKRPFLVEHHRRGKSGIRGSMQVSAHASLDAAITSARKFAKEMS